MRQLLIGILITFSGTLFSQDETVYNRVFDSVVKANQQKGGIAYFQSELKKFPKNELILRSLGALNLQLGNFSETRSYYTKALQVNPNCAKCYFFMAQAFANENGLDEAYKSIEKGLSLDAKEASLYLLRGKLKMYQGNEISGLNDISKAILVDPNSSAPYIERADYYIKKGNYFAAKNDILKARKIDPENPQVYTCLTQIYTYENDLPNALISISKAIELNPSDVKALLSRGEIYAMNNDFSNAVQDYQEAIHLDPENYEAHYYLSEVWYKQEKMDDFCAEITKAIQLIEKYQTASPGFYNHVVARQKEVCDNTQSSYYYQRGIALFNSGKFQEAIAFYDQGIEKFPSEYLTYSFKANAELGLLNSQAAIADYQKSLHHMDQVAKELAQKPQFSDIASKDSLERLSGAFKSSTYLSMAFCYFNLEKTDSALWYTDQSIRFHQNDIPGLSAGDAHFMRGILLLDLGKFQEAEKAFLKLAGIAPGWSICKDYIAFSKILVAIGGKKVSRDPLKVKELKDLANLHWNLEQKIKVKESPYYDQALEQVNAALRLYPQDPFAFYLRGYINRQTGRSACEDFKNANTFGYAVDPFFTKDCK